MSLERCRCSANLHLNLMIYTWGSYYFTNSPMSMCIYVLHIQYYITSIKIHLYSYPSLYRVNCKHPSGHRPTTTTTFTLMAIHGQQWRSRQVLLSVWCLVQQSSDGTAALRRQEAQKKCGKGTAPGAAGRQSGCCRELR